LPWIAQTLGVPAGQGEPMVERLAGRFDGRWVLLVLDNLEQLLTAASSLAALLEASPSVRMLVTSRSSLHLSGEHRYPVLPLAVQDSHDLPLDLDTAA